MLTLLTIVLVKVPNPVAPLAPPIYAGLPDTAFGEQADLRAGSGLPGFRTKKGNRHGGRCYGQRLALRLRPRPGTIRFTDPHSPSPT